ncbi:MAG: hypothetical protein ACM3QU_11795 [Verrucomicrobiota bacterium]
MATLTVTTRITKAGDRRFQVRYRLGGRAYPVVSAGNFKTMREAKIRRDLIAGELAAGRTPRQPAPGDGRPADQGYPHEN